MDAEHEIAQTMFMQAGGVFMAALAHKRKTGELPKQYVYNEYPKAVRINERREDIEHVTETIKGKELHTVLRNQLVWDEVIVHSEEEEERVLSGGKTSHQAEEERQALIHRGLAMGMRIDPGWSIVRLRRELGEKLDAAEPVNKMGALQAELDALRKMADMQAEIEALKAKLAGPSDEMTEMRAQLADLGIKADGRWSLARLREELEKATA